MLRIKYKVNIAVAQGDVLKLEFTTSDFINNVFLADLGYGLTAN